MGKNLAPVLATAVLICGCAAAPPSTTPGTGSGAAYLPMVDMQGVDPELLATDVSDCRGVASSVRVMPVSRERSDVSDAIVLGLGIVVPFGFVSMAVISGVAAVFIEESAPKPADDSLQQKTLVNCMARKGYRNVDPNVTVTYIARASAPAEASAPRTGRDTYMAESYAKARLCPDGMAKAVLESKGPGFERYSVACGSGQRVALRCEFGNCAPAPLELASSK